MIYDPLVSHSVSPQAPHVQSYWRDTFTPVDYPTLVNDLETDVLIIGAGYTGLSAACELGDTEGLDVTVIDSHAIGFGCAGRNAGFVLSGSGRLSLSAIKEKWDLTIALGMQQEFDAAVELVKDRVNQHNISCDMVSGTYLKIAHNEKQAEALCKATPLQNETFGTATRYLDKQALYNRLPIANAYGAIEQPGLALHPLKLIDGYARIAALKGVRLLTHTPALSIKSVAGGHIIATPRGTIRAKKLLIASNAYTPRHFHSLVDGRQFTVQSSILVTNKLTAQQRAATGLSKPLTMMDTRMMKFYYRTLPDGRILFGGRGAVTGKQGDIRVSKQRLYNAMVASFPALKESKAEYFWSGWVSVALDNMPRIYYDDSQNIGYAMGYCGSGVSFASLAGTRLAQRLNGKRLNQALPIYANPLPKFPLPSLRRLGLAALYGWANLSQR
ncbi:FAD-binding oxidoreductase [Alteromonas pelagimontana]|uniref:FAD-binding oxidoreductase n=1 Tax=Alteromonas pelagimontana TaxID=1858656 RepID=A0A6M4MBW0_9ALTE|nr:FAD-binding oxidoreductase [Alteromonas pelagimontana]QJR80110.1 FAD-binding oxidoreductase [Alteromonas pelagimontana]